MFYKLAIIIYRSFELASIIRKVFFACDRHIKKIKLGSNPSASQSCLEVQIQGDALRGAGPSP